MDSRTKSIQGILGLMQKNLECSICLDLLTNPVSTKCDHPFCRFCITEFLKTKTSVPCPLCKCPITKRSLNDRPQLSHIVENVRLLLGAFTKDTGYKYSPPRETSSADFLPCTPEQLPHKEVKGTKRKLPVSDKKKSGRSNVRQSKRRRSDVTLEVTESGDSDRQTDNVQSDIPSQIPTDTENRPVIRKLNQEDSVTNQILSCLRSGCNEALVSANGDTAQNKLNIPVPQTNEKLRETKAKDRNLFSNFSETVHSERHLRPKDKKNYNEDSPTLETFDEGKIESHTESQGQSESNSLPESTPHVAVVTRTYDKKFVKCRDARGTLKVKEWLTSNLGKWRGQGHCQGTSDAADTDSVVDIDTDEAQRGDVQMDDLGKDSRQSENPRFDEGPAETNDTDSHNESAKPLLHPAKEVPQINETQTASSETRNRGSRKIFKSTRNNQPMETSVKQKTGKFLFKKVKPRAVSEISTDQVKAVEPRKSVFKPPVDASKANLKLRELNLNTLGNESDPYEFKSSQITPVKPKVLKRKKKLDNRKKGQVKVEIQKMLNRKSGKSILKKMTVNGSDKAKGGKEEASRDGGKRKKLSPKAIQRQEEEEVALREMQDKISQAEEYDLVTSTQEVLDHMTEEEEEETKGEVAVKNKKFVSFNQDVVFIGSQDQRGVKCLKEMSDSPVSTRDRGNGKERDDEEMSDSPVSTRDRGNGKERNDGSDEKEVEGGRRIDNAITGKSGVTLDPEAENMKECLVVEESENLEGEGHGRDTSSERMKDDGVGVISLDDDDDGNSSSTTDLDIQPDESEFAVPDLDIQPKDVLEKLSSQDFSPHNVASEKNSLDHHGSVEELDVVSDSEDLIQGRTAPIKLNLKSSRRKIGRTKEVVKNQADDRGNGEVICENGKQKDKKEESQDVMMYVSDTVKEADGDRNIQTDDCPRRLVHSAEEADGGRNIQTDDCPRRLVHSAEEADGGRNIQTDDCPRRLVHSADVIPETPLIGADGKLTVVDSSCSPQEGKLVRKNRLKRSPKQEEENRAEIACEETLASVNNVLDNSCSPQKGAFIRKNRLKKSPKQLEESRAEIMCEETPALMNNVLESSCTPQEGKPVRKNRLKRSPETPLIAADGTLTGVDNSCSPQKGKLVHKTRSKRSPKQQEVNRAEIVCEETPASMNNVLESSGMLQEGKLVRKNRFKRSPKQQEVSRAEIVCEETQTPVNAVFSENAFPVRVGEASETVIPPSLERETTPGSEEGCSGSVSTQLSSETQDSQSSLGRRLRKYHKRPFNRKDASGVVPRTPLLGEAKEMDGSSTVCLAGPVKQKSDFASGSQQSLSSLCSTQDSVSILVPVHRRVDSTKEEQSSISPNPKLTSECSFNKHSEKKKFDKSNVEKKLCDEIIEVKSQETDEDLVVKESQIESRKSFTTSHVSNRLSRPKRRCFSLVSPEKGPQKELNGRNVVKGDKELAQQNFNVELQTEQSKEVLEPEEDTERRQATSESCHSGVQLSGDVKSTPVEALIPTQLSLNSIKKKEVKRRKQQQQSSPEDVFLMDSETPGSGSCHEGLIQNQEGLLDLELCDMEDTCGDDVIDSQSNSSSCEEVSKMVGDSTENELSNKTNSSCTSDEKKKVVGDSRDKKVIQDNDHSRETDKRSNENHAALTVPDSVTDTEEVLVDRSKLNIKNAKYLPAEEVVVMEDGDPLSESGIREKSESLNGREVSRPGRRAVRGLARKLKQKNLNDDHLNRADSNGKPSAVSPENSSEVLLTGSEEKELQKEIRREETRQRDGRRKETRQRDSNVKEEVRKEAEDQQEDGAVCKTVVPETVDVDVEELNFDDDVAAVPETVEDCVEDLDVDKEGGEDLDEEEECSVAVGEEDQDVEEDVDMKDRILDQNTMEEGPTCIQESMDESETQKRICVQEHESPYSMKESEQLIDDSQEFQNVNVDNLISKQATRWAGTNGKIAVGELETLMENDRYMATGADDEPLFNSPQSSPLPHILEEECEILQENQSGQCIDKNMRKSRSEVTENMNDSDSSDFVLLPEDTVPDSSRQMTEDRGKAASNADIVEVWEGKGDRERGSASGRRCKNGKGCDDLYNEKRRWESFVDLSDDDDDELTDDENGDDEFKTGTRRNMIKKGEVHDDDEDEEEEEVIGRKKTKKALIISDDEEDGTEIKTSKRPSISNEEDSDLSQDSLTSRQMNLTSSSVFTSQSEGCNTQNEVLLRQELERMKKEMAEIESRIQKGHSTLTKKKPQSPDPSPEVTEEPYSQYLKELQDEESSDDFPHQSQNSVCKMADKVETYNSEDSSDLFLSPLPPSPPPSPPPSDRLATTGIELEFPENFQETENLLQQFGSGKKILPRNKGLEMETRKQDGTENVIDDGGGPPLEVDDKKLSQEFMDPCQIAESPCKADNNITKPFGNSQSENLVIQESPQSQTPSRRSVERLKDLYHSTPVPNRQPGGRKNTLAFLSPVVTPKESSGTFQTGTKALSSRRVGSPSLHDSPESSSQSNVFIASGLPLSQLNELRRLIQSHDTKFHSKFTPSTTHLIVKTAPPGCRMCERTLKFFQALATKCWILDYLWVTDSMAAGRLLEEGPYEITGDTVTNVSHYGPKKSRTRSPADPGILERIQFHIIGSSQSLNPDDIRELVEKCGGSVVRDPEEFDHDGICLILTCADVEDSQESPPSQEIILFNRLYRRYKAVTVSREWLLDSLTVQELQPLNDYVLTSVKGMVIPAL